MVHQNTTNVRKICLSVVILLFLFPVASKAQERAARARQKSRDATVRDGARKPLTLRDALLLALDNQPSIRAAEERSRAQQAILGQAKSAYYPSLTLSNTYRSSLASGTTSTSQKAFDFFSSTANMSWTIYDFGKREGTVQGEKDSLDSQRYATKSTIEGVILSVKQAYYRYLQAKALVRVREDTVKDREQLVRQARGFFEVGTRPRIDVARAESGLFTARADLIAAENGVKIAWAVLKNAIGLTDLPLRPLAEEALLEKPVASLAEQLAIQRPKMSLEQALEVSSAARPELKDFEARRRAQDYDLAVARRRHLPDISFFGQYGRRNTSRGGETFPLQLVWQAGITIDIPIFSGFQTAYEVDEALRNYQEIRALEEETRQQIALEVERSYLNLVEAAERIKATEAAVKAGKENLDLADGRYRVGVGSIIEITEAQLIFTESQTNHIQSITDYKIAEAELARALGQGVNIQP